jgi:hypothetical protein
LLVRGRTTPQTDPPAVGIGGKDGPLPDMVPLSNIIREE